MSDSIPLSPLPRISPDAYALSDIEHDRPPSILEDDAPPDYHPPKDPTSLELHPRSRHALLLALFYAAITLAPWVVICLLNNHPIGGDRYGARTGDDTNYHRYYAETQVPYERSERWYYAARIIQAIASVVTLPLTSAVCASAAVVFMQRQERLTIPQLMALADRGWLDWATYGRIANFQWSRYGSSFLLSAIVVNLLGLVISPLQSVFLSSEVVKTPTTIQGTGYLIDLPTQFGESSRYTPSKDNNIVTIKTRAALDTASPSDRHAHLWTRDGNASACAPYICVGQGATFGNISEMPDPFFAELPSGFNTGLIRQFLPRVNSTARCEEIEQANFPDGCDQTANAFFVEYTNTSLYTPTSDMLLTWGLRACMPADVTQSPWTPTRDRYSFSEELYLEVRLDHYGGLPPRRDFFRVTLDTTTGYFELPNYMNDGIPGSLLDKDPTELCDDQCQDQDGIRNPNSKARRTTKITSATDLLQEVQHKGPLLVIAMALFGDGSFIETRARQPEAYAGTILPDFSSDSPYPDGMSACNHLAPLGHFLSGSTRFGNCISNSQGGANGSDVRDVVAEWLRTFQADAPQLANAFTAAAYLSHKAWMDQGPVEPDSYLDRFSVSLDMGVDREKPVISQVGIVVISTLLGIHVLSLLALGVYAAWTPRWTKRLDSFAIMRIGASIAKHVPLWMVHKTGMVKELDAVPGWIGDQMPESEDVGVLGLGGPMRVRNGRKYLSYHNKPRKNY